MTLTHFGANYIPSGNWLYTWVDWNPSQVARDMESLAGLGLDHVRIQCLWPLLQPNGSFTSPVMLDRLRETVQIANNVGLSSYVCVLNGWMSGFYFRPPWQLERANAFTDPASIDSQLLLLSDVSRALKDVPGFGGVDVANEPNALTQFEVNRIDRAEGDQWIETVLGHVEQELPGRMNVVGVDQVPWMWDRSPFSPTVLARVGAASVVHSWIYFSGALERYGRDSLGTRAFARYLVELARSYSPDVDRPVWLQEIGVSKTWIPESEIPSLAQQMVDEAMRARPWAITWWCSHDIRQSLSGFAPLEYDLGLFTSDNKVKPLGSKVKQIIRDYRQETAPGPTGDRVKVHLRPGEEPGLQLADRFFEVIKDGGNPIITRDLS